jgi:hypothetical protein
MMCRGLNLACPTLYLAAFKVKPFAAVGRGLSRALLKKCQKLRGDAKNWHILRTCEHD